MKTSIELTHGPDAGFGACWTAKLILPDGSAIEGRSVSMSDALRDLANWLDIRGKRALTAEYYPEGA